MKHTDRIEEVPEFIQVDRDSEIRCPNPKCNKLLAKGSVAIGGTLEIKCPRCKTLARFERIN